MKRALAIAVALAGCSGDVKTIDLAFATGARAFGFRCLDGEGRPLAQRALVGRTLGFSVCVDYIGLPGLPTCRPVDIANFCGPRTCAPLSTPPRFCIRLEATLSLADTVLNVLAELLRGLDGRLVTSDAPHQPVIIRAVATAQSHAELEAGVAYDPLQVIGCAVSCPVQLEGVEGEILLDLPVVSDQCVSAVVDCATGAWLEP